MTQNIPIGTLPEEGKWIASKGYSYAGKVHIDEDLYKLIISFHIVLSDCGPCFYAAHPIDDELEHTK